MAKIAIVTDSNSGITQAEGKKLGVYVLPMPFDIDGQPYFEDINLTQEQFYEKLTGDADVSTSQPSPDAVMSLWDDLLKGMMRSSTFRCQAGSAVPVLQP